VRRGLSGAATPSNGSLISAWDLFQYVREQTQSWSQAARPTPQTPILLPETGGQERAERIVLTAKVGTPADWPTAVPFPVPDTLVKHWAAAKELEDGTPSPAVYTPKLWRRYRELLVRYQDLLRAGDADTASKLHDRLTAAEEDLKKGRGLRLVDGQPPRS